MTAPGAPIAEERLLKLRRARSVLTISLVKWRSGAHGVSFGLTPRDAAMNPANKTRFTSILPHEIPLIVRALEEAAARIEAEREPAP